MGLPRDRSGNRNKKRANKVHNHGPLLALVAADNRREKTKARVSDVVPMNKAQEAYDVAIASKDMIFSIGPAGTGKTYLAATRAARELDHKRIEKIIITRPAVEAGEKLGFLPGELEEKFDPYFRPVRDALEDYFGSGQVEGLIASGRIEARPLAYLRGSSLKNCWVLADEMQNATKQQLLLLTSRIGVNAKFLINGDPSQCDLADFNQSGLADAVRRLERFAWCGVANFTVDDIVRSGICRDVIIAYNERPLTRRYNSALEASESESDLAGMRRFVGAES